MFVEGHRFKAALLYASLGWPVFPVKTNDKIPLISSWPDNATTDPDQIKEWFRRYTDANLAIATGVRSGLVILDVDTKNGVDGREMLAKLESQLGPVPETPRVWTPNQGLHYYFSHPGDGQVVKNRTSLLPGLDLRGDGGYVLAPPSSIHGKPYAWLVR